MDIIELGTEQYLKGKAGNLNRVYKEFKVARGFIIPDSVFKNFLKHNNILLEEDESKVKDKILNGVYLEEKELFQYMNDHNYNEVIVRSSVSIEDGDKYSWAGQFKSIPRTNAKTLIKNIKLCWASMVTSNIKSYLEKENINKKDISYDVLVQEMIISDIAGVAFSMNPTNNKKEVVVEVTRSQCEDLVSGNVKPENSILTKEQFIIIENNIKKLRNIFKKEIEIEFCFKDNEFYLFQVRPITAVYFSLSNYVNDEFWCCFKNNNWNLFNRSLWIMGAVKYKNKRINNEVTEDITIYYPYNVKQVRGFNGSQRPLDEITINNHDQKDINNYIDEYYKIVEDINVLSRVIHKNIEDNNYDKFLLNMKKVIKYNALINSYEYLIGHLGQAFHDKLDYSTIKRIEEWRNDEDNSYFPIYDEIFKYVIKYFNIDVNIEKIKMYTHVNELIRLCGGKLKPLILLNRIEKREKDGFVLLNLHHRGYNNLVITNKRVVASIKKRFDELQKEKIEENSSIKGIKGSSTFKNGKIITGECVVVKNNKITLDNLELKNKILVCPVTTAKDAFYLKQVKALIVDNGGILCHSAIFSREFNIPCLMGCEVATSYFETGDLISYDIDKELAYKLWI